MYRQTVLKLGVAQGVLSRIPLAGGQLEKVAQEFGVRALVFSSDGLLMEDTSSASAGLRLSPSALAPRGVSNTRDQAGRVWLYTVSLRPDGTWLVVAAPRPGLAPLLGLLTDELARPLAQGGLIALLLALVLAYALARWIADPLQRLIAAARDFPAGTSNDRPVASRRPAEARAVSEGGPHEVRELARAFNGMIARVEASQRSQRDLVANVSHELKTPLTAIQGFSQALIEGAADTPETRQHAAEVIHEEAERMHHMVVQLLDLAGMDAGTAEMQMSTVDICRLLTAVTDIIRPMADKAGIRVELDCSPEMPSLVGDGDRLGQVFTNLLDNAVKFTPRHGQVSLQASVDEGEARVSVADTGAGIPKADLPRIFDRFYQTDGSRDGGKGHGAGLGLAIAQEIVSAHGGRISVRSTPGRGTEFIVQLPLHGGTRKG